MLQNNELAPLLSVQVGANRRAECAQRENCLDSSKTYPFYSYSNIFGSIWSVGLGGEPAGRETYLDPVPWLRVARDRLYHCHPLLCCMNINI
jgi:hypothetical protein